MKHTTHRLLAVILFAMGVFILSPLQAYAIDWSSYGWLGNGGVDAKFTNKIKATVDTDLGTGFINNLQTKSSYASIHIAMPSAVFGAISLDAADYTLDGAGFFPHLDAFSKQENSFTVVCAGTTYTFTVYYADGEPEDLTDWNLARGKTSVSGKDAGGAFAPSSANDNNTGSRWASGSGAQHYAAVGAAAEDWWYVDLGGFYSIDQIKILFETAAPTDYDLLISNNAVSWTIIGTYTEQPLTGNTSDKYNVYDFSADPKVGRYVKIFARAGYSDLAYGISMWEFEVYGNHAVVSDVTPPVITSATLSGGTTHNQVNLAVAGTDDTDGAVAEFHVVDDSKGVDQACTTVAGVIAVTGLSESTSYSFTVTALDAAGNESGNSIVVAATTTADLTVPSTAAPVPSGTNKEVRPIYSDAFASILEHSFDKDGFAGMPLYQEKNIGGDKCLIYDRSGGALTFTTWGMYDDGANAIIAQSAYRAAGKMGVDASEMEYLHVDIWSLQACATILIRINDGARTGDLRLSHDGTGWKSFDIPMSEFVAGANIDNVRWFKFEAFDAITGKVALDNVYFWKAAAGMKSVSATPNNVSMGTATVKQGGVAVSEVEDGTEVTFNAVANEGYVFVNWSNGETSATFNATVDASMNLTANFRALGTTYCNTEMTSSGHTIYVTMKRSDDNEYKLIIRSNEELTNFGGTVLYKPTNTLVQDLRNYGVLSDGNHTLIATVTSDKDPYFGTPLYVVFAGVGEVTYSKLTDIEYEVACDESVSITSVAVSPSSATLLIGETQQLSATVLPAFAPNTAVTWSSDADAIATVSSTGLVTAHTAGTAHITATSQADGTKSAFCTITVAASIAAVTWHGYGTFTPSEGLTGFNYSITRNADRSLTYSVVLDKNPVGFVAEVNINDDGTYSGMTYNSATRTATYTTAADFRADGTVLNRGFWWLKYAGGVDRVNFSYTVGSENDALPQAVVLNEEIDNSTIISRFSSEEVNAILNRPFTNTEMTYTLCLPFDMSAAQLTEAFGAGWKLSKLTDESYYKAGDAIRMIFDNVSSLEAGVPYMFSPGVSTDSPVTIEGVVIDATTPAPIGNNVVSMTGFYDKTSLPTVNDWFLGTDNYLHKAADGVRANAFRAYFTLGAGAPAGVRARVVMRGDDANTATELDELNNANETEKFFRDGQMLIRKNGNVYTPLGVRVE